MAKGRGKGKSAGRQVGAERTVGRVRIDLFALRKLRADLVKMRQAGGGPEIDAMLKKWAQRVRSFLHTRFDIYSRGGGNWKPLSPLTRKRIARTRWILRDSHTLIGALRPTYGPTPGQFESIKSGVRIVVGYGGHARHPLATMLTVRQLAEIHQNGTARIPKRPIVVDPPAQVKDAMEKDGQKVIDKWVKEHGPF